MCGGHWTVEARDKEITAEKFGVVNHLTASWVTRRKYIEIQVHCFGEEVAYTLLQTLKIRL
jgi:hypothetical protein